MSDTLAQDYAKSVAEGIWDAVQSGYPFGRMECAECGASPEDDCTGTECPEREQASAYDYLSSALDIDYIVSGDGDYKGAEVLIAYGGPNAWIDTRNRNLIVAWWSAPVTYGLPSEFTSELDDALEELWGTR